MTYEGVDEKSAKIFGEKIDLKIEEKEISENDFDYLSDLTENVFNLGEDRKKGLHLTRTDMNQSFLHNSCTLSGSEISFDYEKVKRKTESHQQQATARKTNFKDLNWLESLLNVRILHLARSGIF